MDYWRSVLVSGKPGEIEARLRRFDGVFRWFLFRATEDRRRAEGLLAGENLALEMTAKGYGSCGGLLPVSPLTSTYLLSDRVIKLNQSCAATAPPRQETLC